MKILCYVPHYGWFSGLASSMPNDSFYIVNKIEIGENRGSDLSVVSGYWKWLREIKPKPSNVTLLGQSWDEINTDDYDVVILIADANQIPLLTYTRKMPRVFKFHLKNPGTKTSKEGLLKEMGNYPLIFSAESQKTWYNFNHPSQYVITGGKDPDLYKGWIGDWKQVMWTCERIGKEENAILSNVRWNERGGNFFYQVLKEDPSLPLRRYGLDFQLGTPITPFENLVSALRHSRVYFEAAQDTLLTDGLMEAMMTGMPVIVYPANEMDLVVEHGVNGFKAKTAQEVVQYSRQLLGDYDLAKELGAEARKKALEVWNPQKTEKLHHQAFQEAMDVFNKENNTSRSFHTKIPIPSRTDIFFAESLDKRIQEIEKENEAITGWFRCSLCGEKLNIRHLHGEHIVEQTSLVRKGDPQIMVVGTPPEDILHPEIKELNYIETTEGCPFCGWKKFKKEEREAKCLGCNRRVGDWDKWLRKRIK
jgi:hypothetical protein